MNRLVWLSLLVLYSCGGVKKMVQVNSGTRLTYSYVNGSFQDTLKANVAFRKPTIVFQYTIGETSEEAEIIVTDEARGNARELYTVFDLKNQTFNTRTALWLSDTMYAAMKRDGMVTLFTRQGFVRTPSTFKIVDNQTFELNYSGKKKVLDVVALQAVDKPDQQLWVLDDPLNPLVVKMNIGVSMRLLTIDPAIEAK